LQSFGEEANCLSVSFLGVVDKPEVEFGSRPVWVKPQDLSVRLCGFIQIFSLFGGLGSLHQRPCAVLRTLTATDADYQESNQC